MNQKDQNPTFWIIQQISGYQLKCEFSKGRSRDSFSLLLMKLSSLSFQVIAIFHKKMASINKQFNNKQLECQAFIFCNPTNLSISLKCVFLINHVAVTNQVKSSVLTEKPTFWHCRKFCSKSICLHNTKQCMFNMPFILSETNICIN